MQLHFTRVFVDKSVLIQSYFTFRHDAATLAALINTDKVRFIHVFDEETPEDDSNGRYIDSQFITNFYQYEVDEDGNDVT